jgi:PAS domain-containing protein
MWVEKIRHDYSVGDAGLTVMSEPHVALAVPIRAGHEVRGVIEIFNRSTIAPDPDLLETMSTVANQVGQFIARKQVETAVTEEQRRTRAILDSALDAVIGMDHQGRIADFNAAAERTLGYTRDQALGRALADLIIPEKGGLRLAMKPVDLGTVIGAALDAVRPAAEAKKIRTREPAR